MMNEQGYRSLSQFIFSHNVVLGQIVFPFIILGVYYLSGFYKEVFNKSRIQEVITTILSTFVCTVILYLIALINDNVRERFQNYELILFLWILLFIFTYIGRAIITTISNYKFYRGIWHYNTLIIGNGKAAYDFKKDLEKYDRASGYNILGLVNIPHEKPYYENGDIYELENLEDVCKKLEIKCLIIIPSRNDPKSLMKLISNLYPLNLIMKISPDSYDIIISRARIRNFYGEPLADLSGTNMSASSCNIKRLIDVVASTLTLLILLPLFGILSILIKIDSKGNIIYTQKRVGYHNKEFNIYKFRTMAQDAEVDGIPLLSSENDNRITPLGKFLRKYRLDELPQFWNVIKGDMSIVGPRPERKYYIAEIMKVSPYYTLLHQVRPGITSMGMVKFGYASDVPSMVKRLKYDLLYLENMSLVNDMKIIAYTIKTVLTGKGL